jgi:hypothetical protein
MPALSKRLSRHPQAYSWSPLRARLTIFWCSSLMTAICGERRLLGVRREGLADEVLRTRLPRSRYGRSNRTSWCGDAVNRFRPAFAEQYAGERRADLIHTASDKLVHTYAINPPRRWVLQHSDANRTRIGALGAVYAMLIPSINKQLHCALPPGNFVARGRTHPPIEKSTTGSALGGKKSAVRR